MKQANKKANLSQIITDLQQLEDLDKQDIEYQKTLRLQLQKIEYLKKEYAKKDFEIAKLEQQVEQLKIYYDKYESAKQLLQATLDQSEKLEIQNKLLNKQLSEQQDIYSKLEVKHQQLLYDFNNAFMEKEVHQISQTSTLKFEVNELKSQYNQKISHLEQEIQRLKQQLIEKDTINNALQNQINSFQQQIIQYKAQSKNMDMILKTHIASTKHQMSSYPQSICENDLYIREDQSLKLLCAQLTQDYDEAVKTIQNFERQLTEYRTENIELKKYISHLTDK